MIMIIVFDKDITLEEIKILLKIRYNENVKSNER